MANLKPVFIDTSSGELKEPRNGDVLINEPDITVDTITDLRNIQSDRYVRTKTARILESTDNSSGLYKLDTSDTTTSDDGFNVIVDTDGGRWKLLSPSFIRKTSSELQSDSLENGELYYDTDENRGVLGSVKRYLVGLRDTGKKVNSISGIVGDTPSWYETLFSATPKRDVLGYYSTGDGGGGTFYWDSTEDKANHNGGTVINPAHNSTIGSANWYSASGDSTDTTGSGCWVRPDEGCVNGKEFGLFPDTGDYVNNTLQKVIDYVSVDGGELLLDDGVYLIDNTLVLKENVSLIGESRENTVLKTDEVGLSIIKTESVSSKINVLLSDWTNDILKGDKSVDILNDTSVDDFIIFNTTENFNELYENTKIRPYYEKGELFRIKSSTSTSVTFFNSTNMDLLANSKDHCEYFTPVKNVGIKNITLKKEQRESTGYEQGFWCQGVLNAVIKNVKTINFNDAGIKISHSYNVDCENIYSVGGDTGQSTNYGIVIENGSKYTTINNLYGDYCRHVIATGGGGSLNCVPIYADVYNIKAENSLDHSIDAHSYCMFMNFINGYVDNGVSVSGLFNKAKNIYSSGGSIQIYEGGYGIEYENIVCENTNGNYANNNVVNCKFNNIQYIVSNKSDYRVGSLFKNCTFEKISFINREIENTTSDTEADNTFNSYDGNHVLDVNNDNILKNIYVEGFPTAINLSNGNNVLDGCVLKNCGWDSSYYSESNMGLIFGRLSTTGSTIKDIIFENTNSNLDFTVSKRYIHFPPYSSGDGKLTIKNVRNGANHTEDLYFGVRITSDYEVFMTNVRLSVGAGGNDVQASGKFIFNTVVSDN